MSNDFQLMLVRFINRLDIGLTARLDYFNAEDDIVVNPIPGGKVDTIYMDGTKEVSLPFEIAVKSRDNKRASDIIWTVNNALSVFDLEINSENNTYSFISLVVDKPAINGKDDQGYFIYTLSVIAKLEV